MSRRQLVSQHCVCAWWSKLINAFKNFYTLPMNSAFCYSFLLFAVVAYFGSCSPHPPRVAQVQNLKQIIQIVHGLSTGLALRHSRKFHSSALRRGRAECDYSTERAFWSSICTPALQVAFTPTKWITYPVTEIHLRCSQAINGVLPHKWQWCWLCCNIQKIFVYTERADRSQWLEPVKVFDPNEIQVNLRVVVFILSTAMTQLAKTKMLRGKWSRLSGSATCET